MLACHRGTTESNDHLCALCSVTEKVLLEFFSNIVQNYCNSFRASNSPHTYTVHTETLLLNKSREPELNK